MFLDRESFTLHVTLNRPFFVMWKHIFNRKKTVVVDYKQAVLKEVLQFSAQVEKANFDIELWVLNFIESHTGGKLSKQEQGSVYLQAWKLFPIILETYFKWCFSIKTDDQSSKWRTEATKNIDIAPIQSSIAFLAEKTCTSIIELYEKCTIYDIDYLNEWIIRNLNSQSKDGQKKNKLHALASKAKNRTNAERDAIRQKLAKIPD